MDKLTSTGPRKRRRNALTVLQLPPRFSNMAAASNTTPKRFLDLPLETQKHAFVYLSHQDLLKTLRVSSQFFALACAQLYRDLDFKLSNADGHDGSSSGIQTAEALQTIIASDYNYGQYIKSFRLTMVDDNSQTSAVMSRFLWDRAGFASKALNVSLLLLVKKATMLESFFWDVPIELSGAVYQALQKIQGLRNLRIRLDVSLSLKLTIHPGPLPGSSGISNHPPPPPPMSSSFPPLPSFGSSSQFGSLPVSKPRAIKKKKILLRNFWTGNRELSGFKHLSNLSLLGISSLHYLEEISACMKSNTTTLKSLSLSLSYEMALKARKVSAAPPPADDATSDEEDEELIDPGPPSNPLPIVPTTTEADVRKEKQAQETILARIFDMEQQHHESKRLERDLVQSKEKPDHQNTQLKNAVQNVKAKAKKLLDLVPTGASEDAREAIEMVHKATSDFLNGHPFEAKPSTISNAEATNNDLVAGQSMPSLASPMMPDGPTIVSNDFPPGSSLSTKEEASKGAIQALQQQFDVFNDTLQQPSGLSATSKAIFALQDKFDEFNEVLQQPVGSSTDPMAIKHTLQQPPESSATGASEPYSHWPPLGTASGWNSQAPPPPSMFSDHDLSNPVPPSSSEATISQEPVAASADINNLVNEQTGDETTVPITATLIAHEPMDESLDIDMTHPDEDPSELIADQEVVSDEEAEGNVNADVDLPSPRKRGRFETPTEAVNADKPNSSTDPTSATTSPNDVSPKKESPEEAMQMWIRERHGYQLEEIKLYWVPMRAGILSRALDLAVLRRITLLNCGPQDGFWMILAGFQTRQGTIGLKSIHTDNVSKSFLKFLKMFGGLTELFMHERTKKIDVDASSSHARVGITDIRQQALRKHLKTLVRLMIKNETDSSWDLDSITIMLLSTKGSSLQELAISLASKQFVSRSAILFLFSGLTEGQHHLMQNLSALKNLQALHLLAVRGANGGGLSHLEYLNSISDNLAHHPLLMRLKYISVENILSHIHRRPVQLSRKFKQAKARRQQDRLTREKGKGKGKMPEMEVASDASSETDFRDDKELHDMFALKVKASMLNDPKEVEHVKIFQHEFRAGAF
ncbi:MAG: hypothetical protein Q9168_001135 [Polycauliona sp. 1 TL-2023]